MEDTLKTCSIEDSIQTIADLFTALTSDPQNNKTIIDAKIKYPIPETLTIPHELLFDNPKPFYQSILFQILYTIGNNYKKINETLELQHKGILVFFIESLRIVAKHSKLYETKEIKFYFSIFRDILLCPLESENLIKNFLIHLSIVGKIELSDIRKPFLQKHYYKYLVDRLEETLDEKKKKICSKKNFKEKKYEQIELQIEQLKTSLKHCHFLDIWNTEKLEDKKEYKAFKGINYDDSILLEMVLTYFPFKNKLNFYHMEIKMEKYILKSQECDNFMNVFYSSLYSEVLRKKFAHIMKSEPINNYYLNLGNEDQQIKNNYAKFISFIDENNGIIPQSAIDHYIIPLTMRKGVHGVTTNYQRIAINSYYKFFKMISEINKSDKGFEDLSVMETLFIASLIVIGLHESNHFLRRYGRESQPTSSVITPRGEGGAALIEEIFGNSNISQLYLEQAKLILDISSWKKNLIIKLFVLNAEGPSMKFMANTKNICFRSQ